MKCKHYEGDGYGYETYDDNIWLCEKCNNVLLVEMLKQKLNEMEIDNQDYYDEENDA